jgi:thiosulfate dehydrogenase [quinone] large subunit
MTHSSNSSAATGSCTSGLPSGASLGFIVLRLWLAVRALLTALEKFSGTAKKEITDQFGAIGEVESKVYGFSHYHGMAPSLEEGLRAQPLMPGWMLTAYGYALGPALIILGITLLLGIATRLTLFLMGLVYISLTVGMILLGGQNEILGTAMLGVHVIMIALALKWAEHDRWCLCKKC